MSDPLRILFIEDLPADKELAERQLRAGGLVFSSLRVDSEEGLIRALDEFQPDIIISDYSMPAFDGMQALLLTRKLRPDLPFIILTGSMNEDTAVECMKTGAADYVIKEHIHRLPYAVIEALKHNRVRKEKELADKQLRESEEKFRALFNNNHTTMLVIDPADGRIIDANPAACTYYGWDRETLLGMYISDINTLSKEEVAAEMKKAVTEERNFFIFRHRLANGQIRPVEVFSGPIRLKGKNLLYSIVHDISARMQAEKELQDSENRYRSLIAHSPDAIFVNHNDRIILVNLACMKLFGAKSPDELVGKSPYDLFHPRYHQNVRERIHLLRDLGQPVPPVEEQIVRLDGTVVDTETLAAPFSVDGENYIHVILRDITQRKQAEQQVRLQAAALNAAANAIIITDPEGRIEWVNPAFIQLTGYSETEAIGRNPRFLKSGFQDPAYYENLWNTILSGRQWRGELVNRRKDGSLYTEEEAITPLTGPDGKISHFIGIKVDITDRKNKEEALKQKNRLQEQIASLGRELAATLDLPTIYKKAWEHLRTMVDCPYFRIHLLDTGNSKLSTVFWVSDGEIIDPAIVSPIQFNVQSTSSRRVKAVITKKPVIVGNLEEQPSESGKTLTQSAMYVPMLAGDQAIGLLDLRSYRADAYTEQDGEWMSVVANQIGLSISNASFFSQTRQRIKELQVLHQIDQIITTRSDPDDIYRRILEQIMEQPYVDAADVWIFNPQNQMLEYNCGFGFHHPHSHQTRLTFGEGLAGKVALERQIVRILNPAEEVPGLIVSEDWHNEQFTGYIGLPLTLQQNIVGVLEIFFRHAIPVEAEWFQFMSSIAQQFSIAIDDSQLFQQLVQSNRELVQAYDATIAGWSQAMDLRDKETEGHTRRVTEITVRIAKALGIKEEKLVHIRRGAMLHDIGKLGVPDDILLKPGTLTDEEWEVMKKHPVFAYDMLKSIEYLQPALAIPYCHHEKWDGSGYPRGLKGQQIPLEARVFAIVDVYDALTSDRPYRSAWSQEKALQYIQEQSGKHFDPKVVAAFMALMKSGGIPDI